MIPDRLDTVQLTQEKEKSSVAQCSTRWFKRNFLECVIITLINRSPLKCRKTIILISSLFKNNEGHIFMIMILQCHNYISSQKHLELIV